MPGRLARQAVLFRHALRIEVDLDVQPDGKRGCIRGVSEMTFRLLPFSEPQFLARGPVFVVPQTTAAAQAAAGGADAGGGAGGSTAVAASTAAGSAGGGAAAAAAASGASDKVLRLHCRQSRVLGVTINGAPVHSWEHTDRLLDIAPEGVLRENAGPAGPAGGGAGGGAAAAAAAAAAGGRRAVRDAAALELAHRVAIASAERGELALPLPADLDADLAAPSGKARELVVAVAFELRGPTAGAHFRPGACAAFPARVAHMFAYSRADGGGVFGGGPRLWFPCVGGSNQPRAGVFEVAVTVAAGLMAISSGVLVEQRELAPGVAAEGTRLPLSHAASSSDASSGDVGDGDSKRAAAAAAAEARRTYCYLSDGPLAACHIALAVGPFLALPDPLLQCATHFVLPGTARAAALRHTALRADARGRTPLFKVRTYLLTYFLTYLLTYLLTFLLTY